MLFFQLLRTLLCFWLAVAPLQGALSHVDEHHCRDNTHSQMIQSSRQTMQALHICTPGPSKTKTLVPQVKHVFTDLKPSGVYWSQHDINVVLQALNKIRLRI